MKRLILIVVLAVTAPIAAQTPKADTPAAQPTAKPTLTEAQRLKGEVLKLQIQVERLREQLAQANQRALATTAPALEADFLATLQAPKGATWDWAAMAPVLPPTPTTDAGAKPTP
jgi:hypothetical protein